MDEVLKHDFGVSEKVEVVQDSIGVNLLKSVQLNRKARE